MAGECGTGVGMVWVACEHVDKTAVRGEGGVCGAAVEGGEARVGGTSIGARVGGGEVVGEGRVCGAAVEGWGARVGGASVGAKVGGGDGGRVGRFAVGRENNAGRLDVKRVDGRLGLVDLRT